MNYLGMICAGMLASTSVMATAFINNITCTHKNYHFQILEHENKNSAIYRASMDGESLFEVKGDQTDPCIDSVIVRANKDLNAGFVAVAADGIKEICPMDYQRMTFYIGNFNSHNSAQGTVELSSNDSKESFQVRCKLKVLGK